MTSESPDALESLVGRIADEFTRRHHRGEGPRVEEYTDRYPALAALLREILPTIQALGPAAGGAGETPGTRETPGGGAVVPPPLAVDDYEVLGEIGRGGMAVVHKARHRRLGRIVALKVLRGDAPADLARFRGEAEAVARLQHPNVVQIFEVREVDGRPLLALEFVSGGTLAQRTKGEPQPPGQAAAIVRTLARAIAAAHDRGLVHRDLKPSNILLAADDDARAPARAPADDQALDRLVPKVSDFGLAKRLDEDLGQTQTGAIVGTPGYMAPEQATAGSVVGPAADIYALGAILYELVAGRPPFKGPSVLETLELVRHAEPTPPTQLQPGCPRDLETICLKCLRKDPARRYPTAADLADDLQRFLDGVPIRARPVGGMERLGKWLRRRPAVAASIGLGSLAALAVVALAVRLVYSWELEDANGRLGEAVGERDSALVAADAAQARLDAALGRERALHYVHSVGLARQEWQANRVDEARRLLDACPPDLRHWEWYYLHRQCHAELLAIRGHAGELTALAVSPTGHLIATACVPDDPLGSTGHLRVWDSVGGNLVRDLGGPYPMITGVALSTEGALLAFASLKTIRVWDLRAGRERYSIPGPTTFGRVAFSPDGTKLAATAGPQIRVFDAANGTDLFTLPGHTGATRALAFSADGRRLVSGGADRLVKLWDLTARKEVFNRAHTWAVVDVAFSPAQDQIMSCASGETTAVARTEIRLWDAGDGKRGPAGKYFPFRVTAAAFTANSGQIACAGADGGVHFFDAVTGKTTCTLRGHAGEVKGLVATRDGTRLVTCSSDRTVRVWPVHNPEFDLVPQNRPTTLALAFSADGARLAVSDFDPKAAPETNPGGVRIVTVPAAEGSREIRPTKPLVALAFSSHTAVLAGADPDGVHLWDADGAPERRAVAEPGVLDMSFSPDGRLLATATVTLDAYRWPNTIGDAVAAVLVRPLAQRRHSPAIRVWRLADGQLVRTLAGQNGVAFSPDGRQLAGARGASVVVWDAATGEELRTFAGPADLVLKVQYTAGGRQVVGFTRRQATVWDTETGRAIATVDGLNGPAAVTPDGRRIVGLHGGIKWWDVQTGGEALFLALPEDDLRRLVLSPDGRRVAASGSNNIVLWEAGPP